MLSSFFVIFFDILKPSVRNKIIVAHHSNQLGLGGTEKTMQLFCKYLDKECFEVHALAPRFPVKLSRIWRDRIQSFLGSKKATDFLAQIKHYHIRLPEFQKILGEGGVHLYSAGNLKKILQTISPQILHLYQNGFSEPPLTCVSAIQHIPVIFSTHVFGEEPQAEDKKRLSKILFVSHWLKNEYAKWSQGDARCDVLYCPIEKPSTDTDLRSELQISKDIFVLGRIGCNADDIHVPIPLQAYKQIETEAVFAPEKMKKEVKEFGIKNGRYLEPTVDEIFLSKFYNTMDILAHARHDGETFGCVIAEAMMHGKPVVTHRSHIRNSQAELVTKESGFEVEPEDWQKYAVCLKLLRDNKELRLQMGASAKKRALENFEAEMITKKLENFYFEELDKIGLIGV